MRFLLILALVAASRLGAQATSQRHIPIRKQHQTPVDTVVLRLVDTVTVLQTDTVFIAAGSVAPLATFDTLMKTDSVNCGRGLVPIPVPIPLGHSSASAASTVPEPASVWLVGTGLIAIGFVWGRKHKRR